MKGKLFITTLTLMSVLLTACGSKESEQEVSAVENEATITEASTVEESVIDESAIEESVTDESTVETSESESETKPMTDELSFIVTELDKDMYVSQECDTYTEPYDTSVTFLKLNKGDLLHLTGEIAFQENLDDAVWYQFQADNGETGYVDEEYLTSENPNAAPEVEVAQQPQSQPAQPETPDQSTQAEQPPASSETAQQPAQTEQQPESSSSYDWNPDNIINPETGLPLQPGDEYWLDDGHHTKVTVPDEHFWDDWGK